MARSRRLEDRSDRLRFSSPIITRSQCQVIRAARDAGLPSVAVYAEPTPSPRMFGWPTGDSHGRPGPR